ncbi:MAG TPA: dienelactone hydrolase family protein, partial [Stellaceae bacterium]|nr:dienelactone hydrolase family protein [Stellaceae bacterium]
MNLTLSGPSHLPHSGGKAKRLIILLHGLGADGNDLIGLAPYWAPLLPDAEFLSPNAPFPCDMAPYGYQWMSAQDPSPEARLAGARAAAAILDAFITDELAKRELTESELALVGFSQGTMMSLFVGPRRENQLAGIVGYSGRLIAPELLADEIRSRPPVLLVHGTHDPVVPFSSLAEAEAPLRAAGVPVET